MALPIELTKTFRFAVSGPAYLSSCMCVNVCVLRAHYVLCC